MKIKSLQIENWTFYKTLLKTNSLILIGCLFFLAGCQKDNQLIDTNTSNSLQNTNRLIKTQTIVNESLNSYLEYKDGSQSDYQKEYKNFKNSLTLFDLCSGYFEEYPINAQYYGHVSQVYCSQQPSTTVGISFFYNLYLPTNIELDKIKMHMSMAAGGWPSYPPSVPITTPIVLNAANSILIGSGYDSDYETDFNIYRVEFQYNISYSNFCSYSQYRTRIRVLPHDNCQDIPQYTSSWTPQIYYTSNGYQHSIYSGYVPNNITNTFIVSPTIILCSQHCHWPTLGLSSKHEVQYRLVGTSNWIPAQTSPSAFFTDLNDKSIVVPSSGEYEIRSRGEVYPAAGNNPAVFSDWDYHPLPFIVP